MEGAAMARYTGVSVLLVVLVTASMYTCAFLGGAALGRAMEAGGSPDHRVGIAVSIRGVVHYFTKELSDGKAGRSEDARLVMTSADAKMPSNRNRGRRASSDDPQGVMELSLPTAPRARSNFSQEITNACPRRSVVKVGPWGGSGGQPFYMRGSSVPRLRSITLYHSPIAIHSLSVAYDSGEGAAEKLQIAGPWGIPDSFGSRAARATINLSEDEQLTAVEGTYGHSGRRGVPGAVVTSLTFRTSAGRTYGPYGAGRRSPWTSFSVPAANGCIVGFWGRSGWLVDAVGVYVRACTPAPAGLRN